MRIHLDGSCISSSLIVTQQPLLSPSSVPANALSLFSSHKIKSMMRVQVLHARKRSSALFVVGRLASTTMTLPTTAASTTTATSRLRSRLFGTIGHRDGPEQQHHQRQKIAVSNLDVDEPLRHSNPQIQILLDRYHAVCADGPPELLGATALQQQQQDEEKCEIAWENVDPRSPSRAVFSNNLVDLSRIEVVGFDYDYTLATCELHFSTQPSSAIWVLCPFIRVLTYLLPHK